MTLFIKIEDNKPASNPIAEENFRQLFPHTSFPAYFSPEMVEPLGYGIYDFSPQPEILKYQKCIEIDPIYSENKIWKQSWQVIEMTEEEKNQVDEEQKSNIRGKRNLYLITSDWSQLDDTPVTNAKKLEWAEYRQALRDIPQQAGFPHEVTWPTKP